MSKPCLLETGVPQGSGLGSVVVSLYTRSPGSAVTSHGFSDHCYAGHLKLNLSKTELLFIPGKDCPHMDLSVTVEDVMVSPSSTAKNVGVILNDGLSSTPNIISVVRSCRFALYRICRIGLSSQRTQRNSWSKRWSSPASTTVPPSWLDSQPL